MLETPSFKFIYFMYGVHALPYINSASNFILYGLLNRQVRLKNCWFFVTRTESPRRAAQRRVKSDLSDFHGVFLSVHPCIEKLRSFEELHNTSCQILRLKAKTKKDFGAREPSLNTSYIYPSANQYRLAATF